ncbi:hypothetical protein CJ255_20870 [Candidatus Viridilinea mediisalina]|uniref:PglD N-terminal domain-containing protein n=2 Tax=Candidatus Viridilinea mediisalina TaxID=2024553 RepID=A0A2A6RDF1_9CHLR|nr:hypothetical protein CJ255_20870 [Candidatus Viridilinea mediisalina]
MFNGNWYNMTKQQVMIYGAGGFAREVAWLAEACSDANTTYEVVCFIDDNEAKHGQILNDIPVTGLVAAAQQFPQAQLIAAIGAPAVRQTLMAKVADLGVPFATLMHPRVERSKWLEIGAGTVICAGSILTTNIVLGNHVQINLDCTIGHDVILADYATLAPGVHISGCVQLGERVYVGTGAVIINGTQDTPLVIGHDAVIGAGACVTRDVAPHTTVVGVPARPLPR